MKKMKIGVFGAGRGMDLATNFMLLGCDIVALCDSRTEMLEQFAPQLSEGGRKSSPTTSTSMHPMQSAAWKRASMCSVSASATAPWLKA